MTERVVNVPGMVLGPGNLKIGDNYVYFEQPQTGQVTVRTKGLVLSICGGGNVRESDSVYQETIKIVEAANRRGGIIVNGGENGGTMLAAVKTAPEIVLGVACPYHKLAPLKFKSIVDNYQTRKMIITAMPVVVVFPGQVGTLDELMTCIGWIKSLTKQGNTPPELWVHKYWFDVLELLYNKDALQKEVWEKIHHFSNVDEIKL